MKFNQIMPKWQDIWLVLHHPRESLERIQFDTNLYNEIHGLINDYCFVIGDMNNDPYSVSIGGVGGLYARHDIIEASKQNRKMLRNHTWQYLAKRDFGTYRHQSPEKERDWRILDQIYSTGNFKKVRVKIETTLGHQMLLKKTGNIDDSNYTDHLPVKAVVEV